MPDSAILDASAWLAVLLREQGSEVIQAHMADRRLLAPELIKIETANGILMANRRGRMASTTSMTVFLTAILDFPIDAIPAQSWWKSAVLLAERHLLTFYDAAYLACARELQLPLLTLDAKLLKACISEKVEVLK